MHQTLYDVVERDGIILEYAALAGTPDRLLGLYYIDKVLNSPVIILDNSLRGRVAEHDTVLAEEVGHHITLPRTSLAKVSCCYASRIAISKDEARAIRWACDIMIPDDRLRVAIRSGYREAWQLAEYFQVTEWLVHQKYGHLKSHIHGIGWQMLQALELFDAAGS